MADDSTDNGGGPVFRLIYRSRLQIPDDAERKEQVAAILSVARRKNPAMGITGALIVWDDSIVQTLEGEESAVRALYDTIHEDRRHEQVELVETTTGVGRAFPKWSMAHLSDDDQPDIPLGMRPAGEYQSPRFVSPEEDAVIKSMRDRVRGASA